jgi:hypothetical protein
MVREIAAALDSLDRGRIAQNVMQFTDILNMRL